MNTTKKILLILATIFAFGDMAWNIYDIVDFFMLAPQNRPAVFYLVYSFLELFAAIAVAVLLILVLWKNGAMYRRRYGLYMSALVISLIINLFSLSTLFLIISMFVSDFVWIKPDKVVPAQTEKSREEKIASLRERHEKGELSDEEYQSELTKLL